MEQPQPLEPWNVHELRQQLLDTVLELRPIPLRDAAVSGSRRQSGCYLHFITDDALVTGTGDTFGAYLPALGAGATGTYPLYCGSSTCLRDRAQRYLAAWAGHDRLLAAISVINVPTTNFASARFSEELLIEALAPDLQASGYGNHRPGAGRSGGRHSPADALFWPGRYWTSGISGLDRLDAQLQAISRLARRNPDGPRW